MVLKFLIASQHRFASAVKYRKDKKREGKQNWGSRKGEHNRISFYHLFFNLLFVLFYPSLPTSTPIPHPPKTHQLWPFLCVERAFLQSKCWNECEECWILVWKTKDWKEKITEALNTVLDTISDISRLALLLLFLG